MMSKEKQQLNVTVVHHEFVQLRALCDEIMNSLCQAKALLEPVNQEDFFNRFDAEVLRHYFYALDTIINSALKAKDDVTQMVDKWLKATPELSVD